jgi:response regulator NasT
MRFQARQQLINDVENAKTKLRERKLVERAKGILMEKKKLSEQEAYRVMRQAAMNRAQPLVQVAASVIQVSELLHAS